MLNHLGKKIAVATLLLATVFTTLSCNAKTKNLAPNGAELPVLTTPDAVFFQGADFAITYAQIYEQFKANDGINQLLFMVDTHLFATELAAVSQADIDAKIKFLQYGTSDDAIIAELSEDDKASLEENYAQNIFLLGYQNDAAVYARMLVAKENIAVAAMLNPVNKDLTWYVSDTVIKNDYVNNYFEDIAAIKIRFFSETDAKTAMRSLNLVSYQGDLRLYTGTKPIEEVSSNGFNNTNTRVLTEAEVLLSYIRLYNYAYAGWKPLLPETTTVAELLANDEFTFANKDIKAIQTGLETYMYTSLNSRESFLANSSSNLYYSYQPMRYAGSADTSHYMILKLTGTPKVDLSTFTATQTNLNQLLGQDLYDELKEKIIDSYLETSGFVAERISEARSAAGLVVHDYYLGVDYQSIATTFELDVEGSQTVVASLTDGFSVTADQLLAFALQKNAALYTVYAAQLPAVMAAHFENVYCRNETADCVFDLDDNKLESIAKHVTELDELKASYEESYYRIYYTFEEYIYLAYGAKSDAEMIENYYIKSKLQPFIIYDQLKKDDFALIGDYFEDLVQDYYDNYFSLNAKTLLIFVDRDENGSPDNYVDFLADLTDRVAYDAKLAAFETAIKDYIEENDVVDFSVIVNAYNTARRSDAVWGEFKQFGFGLNAGNPSSGGSITYLTTIDSYEDELIAGFQAAYNAFLLPENISKASYHHDEPIQTKAGLYLIYAEKGTNFTKPSAQFTMTYTNSVPNYSVGSDNASHVPSIAQLKLFSERRFYEIVYGTDSSVGTTYGVTIPKLPSSLLTAMDVYYTKLHDSIYVVGFLNIIVADLLAAGTFQSANPEYSTQTDAAIKATLQAIKDLYFEQVFQSLDTVNE
jgi:hypothetical protein